MLLLRLIFLTPTPNYIFLEYNYHVPIKMLLPRYIYPTPTLSRIFLGILILCAHTSITPRVHSLSSYNQLYTLGI